MTVMPENPASSGTQVCKLLKGMLALLARVWNSPTLMTWLSMVTRIGGLAILVPIVVTRLGAPEVLVWQMLSSITLLVTLTDFGFSPTFARLVAFARGGGTMRQLIEGGRGRGVSPPKDRSEFALGLSAVLFAQVRVYRRVIVIAALISATGGTFALWRPIGAIDSPVHGWIAWLFASLSGLLILANGANVAVLTGFDRIALARRVDAVLSLLQLASTCVVALLGFGLLGTVICYSLWTLPLFFFNRHYRRKIAEPAEIEATELDPRLVDEIWRSAWRSGVGVIASTGIIQASGLVYAQIASVPDAAEYLLVLRAVTVAAQLSQAPFYSRLPRMAQLRAEGRIDEVANLAKRGMAMAFWTYAVTSLSAILIAPTALSIIGSSVTFPPYPVCLALATAFFIERYCAMHIQIYSLTHHIIWHVMNGITGTLMLAISITLFPLVGQIALPLAMLLGYACVFVWYGSELSLRSMNESRVPFELRTSAGPFALLVIVGSLALLKI